MPRITGANLAEHVAVQRTNVVNATRALVSARGVAGVSLADIAHEVGLSRTALYRYFPTKAHILIAWFDQEMDKLAVAADAAATCATSPADSLRRWLDVQLAYLDDSEHRALTAATADLGDLPADLVAHVAARHRDLYASIDGLLAVSAPDPALRAHRAVLIAGLLRASAESLSRGADEATVRAELHRGAQRIADL